MAVSVFDGNTADSPRFLPAVQQVRQRFGLDQVLMVGDRGMISSKAISGMRSDDGIAWITALEMGHPGALVLTRSSGARASQSRTMAAVTVAVPDPSADPCAPERPGGSLRRIAHLDMDAFFASVELLRYPQLKGLPVVIGGRRREGDALLPQGPDGAGPSSVPVADFARLRDYVGRGVITTATYAARQFGVGSAMGMMKAARLCPQAIVLPVDADEVRRYSRLFKSTITEIAPVMQDRGVDEVYIDFTEVPGGQREGGRVLARLIQKSIFDRTGLTCSIGVAPNRLLAKMASEFDKPNGVSIVYAQDLQSRIWPLDVRKISGIGPKAGAKLAALGVHTIGELAAQDPQWLVERFGKSIGAWMHRAAWGQDDSPVVTTSEPVSMSRETTFERDLHAVHDRAELGRIFTDLCMRLAQDLQRKGYVARTIGVKLRYDDFRTATREQTACNYTADGATIRQLAGQCLRRVPLDRRLRLLGVRAGTLVRRGEEPGPSARTYGQGRDAQDAMGTGQLF
ncbi:DNA polymerase IV [Verminephrobacter aporrectodeae subsp. tuberculatae]|nr:DNA polymerase IV [Verminephrobacter aporrectodeae subsp. tuberculatae]MCW8168565.1 DNA polymerase IV [Verminephrobacter aporrectodeae subsp. tuberculatae]